MKIIMLFRKGNYRLDIGIENETISYNLLSKKKKKYY